MSERMKWISPKNTSQIQWALSYLKEKSGNPGFWHTRYIGETAYQQLIKWDQGRNRSMNPVLADGFFQEAEAEAGEQFHGSSAS